MAQRTCLILWIFQLEKYLEIVHHLKNICILFNFTTTSLEKKAEWMISVFRIFKLTVWKNKRNGSLIAVESLYISCSRSVFWMKKGEIGFHCWMDLIPIPMLFFPLDFVGLWRKKGNGSLLDLLVRFSLFFIYCF